MSNVNLYGAGRHATTPRCQTLGMPCPNTEVHIEILGPFFLLRALAFITGAFEPSKHPPLQTHLWRSLRSIDYMGGGQTSNHPKSRTSGRVQCQTAPSCLRDYVTGVAGLTSPKQFRGEGEPGWLTTFSLSLSLSLSLSSVTVQRLDESPAPFETWV